MLNSLVWLQLFRGCLTPSCDLWYHGIRSWIMGLKCSSRKSFFKKKKKKGRCSILQWTQCLCVHLISTWVFPHYLPLPVSFPSIFPCYFPSLLPWINPTNQSQSYCGGNFSFGCFCLHASLVGQSKNLVKGTFLLLTAGCKGEWMNICGRWPIEKQKQQKNTLICFWNLPVVSSHLLGMWLILFVFLLSICVCFFSP